MKLCKWYIYIYICAVYVCVYIYICNCVCIYIHRLIIFFVSFRVCDSLINWRGMSLLQWKLNGALTTDQSRRLKTISTNSDDPIAQVICGFQGHQTLFWSIAMSRFSWAHRQGHAIFELLQVHPQVGHRRMVDGGACWRELCFKRSSRESTRKPRSAIVGELFIQESGLLQPIIIMNDSHFWGVRSCYLFIQSLDWGRICRKPWFLPLNMEVSCKFPLKPIHWLYWANFPGSSPENMGHLFHASWPSDVLGFPMFRRTKIYFFKKAWWKAEICVGFIKSIYPLVNVQKTMENHHFYGKINYFYDHFQ